MKIAAFFFLLASFISFQGFSSNAEANADNLKRIYIYFSDLSISDNLFNVSGEFYSVDGKKYESEGTCMPTNNIATKKLDARLWYLDIPKNSKTCYFYIRDKENELWSGTDLYSVNGCIFEYSTSNYARINENSGWHNISITMDQFADYFLSRVNIKSDSFTEGFMAYKSLHDSLFVSISDYEVDKENSIRWNDTFLETSTSFKEKWEIIKTLYIANYKPEEKVIWPYFLGGCLIILTGYLTYSIVIKKTIKRKKNERKID